MRLTKWQQNIVQAISEGKITDILSFVKFDNLGEEVCFSDEEVKERFEKAYSNKKFLCNVSYVNENYIKSIAVGRIDNGNAYLRAQLSFDDAYSRCRCNNVEHVYGHFSPVYISSAIDKIISFIALWQYLHAQALIIELPKTCLAEDMALFLKKIEGSPKSIISLSEDRKTPYEWSQMDVPSSDFFDGGYELDEENFEICYPYLTKKIYAAPELKNFIQKKYNTTEELNSKNNLRIALAGVVIAIVTSVASIWISTKEKDYSKELNKIESSLQDIGNVISDAMGNDNASLQEIKEELSAMAEDRVKSTEFKEIIESLQDIREELSGEEKEVNEDEK